MFKVLLLSSITVFAGCSYNGASTSALPAHKASLEFYVMSKCPYGVQVEKAIGPVKQQLGDAFTLSIDFIGKGEPGDFTSMHGPEEITGDIAQLCVGSQAPDKMLEVVLCMDEDPKQVATNWKECSEKNGVDVGAVESCVNGDQGQQLLAASFKRAADRHATGSPTVFLDGEKYSGGRKGNDFLRSLCGTFAADAPAPCLNIPVPPKVSAVFLSDSRCKTCDLHPVEAKLKGTLAGLEVTYVDYSTPEGQALYAKLRAAEPDFKLLPAALLNSAEVDKDADGKQALERYLTPVGEYQSLRVGAKFDPTSEICDNQTDDDGNGAVDCADDDCSPTLACRVAMPKKLDAFVMSHCPYGAKAMMAANDMLPLFGKDEVDFDVHFIGTEADGQLTSMHGPTEVDDDVREICAATKYPKDAQFVKFLGCMSKNYKAADWKGCASEASMDPGVIQKCFDGEGKSLLRKSFAEAEALDIASSPTFLVNNHRTFNAIAADKLQQEYCQDNPGLKGCEAVMPASVQPAPSSGKAAPAGGGDASCGG